MDVSDSDVDATLRYYSQPRNKQKAKESAEKIAARDPVLRNALLDSSLVKKMPSSVEKDPPLKGKDGYRALRRSRKI